MVHYVIEFITSAKAFYNFHMRQDALISVNVVVEHPGLVLEQLAAVHLYRS